MTSLMADRKELSHQKRLLQEKLGEGPFAKVRECTSSGRISTDAKCFMGFHRGAGHFRLVFFA